MYIQLPTIIAEYGLYNDKAIRGIIHVGAHTGEESTDYKACAIPKVVWVEPWKPAFDTLVSKFQGDSTVTLLNCAFGDIASDNMPMHVDTTNFGLSSSIMAPKVHLQEYPGIQFNERATVKVRRMDQFAWLRDGSYNFLNMDVQGYELKVLQGGPETLKSIDYVYTEVNRAEIYEGCARIEQLDAFLYEFTRAKTFWCEGGERGTWGDALYIRKK